MPLTSGLRSIDHELPSQRSMRLSGTEPFCWPCPEVTEEASTAQHSSVEMQLTVDRAPVSAIELGATDHVVPSHRSAIGSLKCPAALIVDPTAQQSPDSTQVTPLSAALGGLCGLDRIEPDQVEPFQWSTHGTAPWDLSSRSGMRSLRSGFGDAVPTAQQSAALTQLTDESWSASCPEAGMACLVQDDPSQ